MPIIVLAYLLVAGASRPAAAAPPSGKADVYTTPSTLAAGTLAAGSTFDLAITVEPRSVAVDAVAVRLAFDPAYLEVAQVASGGVLDTLLAQTVDNATGTLFYAAGKLTGPWPSTTFLLATVTFRLKAAPAASLAISLVTGGANATGVAANGANVLNSARGTTIELGPPAGSGSGGSAGSGGSSGGSRGGSSGSSGGSAGSGGSSGGSSGSAGGSSSGGGASSASSGASSAGSSVPPAPSLLLPVATPAPSSVGAPPVLVPLPASAATPGPDGLFRFVPPLPATIEVGAAPVAVPFAQVYTERDGLRLLGHSLAPAGSLGGILAQYFEKGRLEAHPEEPEPAWRFQYGLLVDELLAAGAPLPVGGDASTLTYAGLLALAQPAQRVSPPEGFGGGTALLPDGSSFIPFSATLAPEAGHVVPAIFWQYVNDPALFPGGWLHDVGLPVTEPVEAIVDKGPEVGRRIVVQAFQRTILTYDPRNPPAYQVERANVGTDYARAFPQRFAPASTPGAE